jgi:transposase
MLKEQLRQIYQLPPAAAERLLDGWLKWARRCRLTPFVKLARTIPSSATGSSPRSLTGFPTPGSSQINTQIRLIARRAFGFHSPQALIALAMLKLADLCPPLPR